MPFNTEGLVVWLKEVVTLVDVLLRCRMSSFLIQRDRVTFFASLGNWEKLILLLLLNW